MSLYVDSADRAEVLDLLACGAVAGVTTNPILLSRAGLGPGGIAAFVEDALAAGAGRVFVQAIGLDAHALAASGRRAAAIDGRVVVKVPCTSPGVTAARSLVDLGVPVLLTAVFHPAQALLAAAVGATWVAPYVGRISDAGRDGVAQVDLMQRALAGSDVRVLAASIRSLDDAAALAAAAVTDFALNPALCRKLLDDELSVAAALTFEEASAASPP